MTPQAKDCIFPVFFIGVFSSLLRSLGGGLFLSHAGPKALPFVFFIVDSFLACFILNLPKVLKTVPVSKILNKILIVGPTIVFSILLLALKFNLFSLWVLYLSSQNALIILFGIFYLQWLATVFPIDILKEKTGILLLGLPLGAIIGGILSRFLTQYFDSWLVLVFLGPIFAFIGLYLLTSKLIHWPTPFLVSNSTSEGSIKFSELFKNYLFIFIILGGFFFTLACRFLEASGAKVLVSILTTSNQLSTFYANYEIISNSIVLVIQLFLIGPVIRGIGLKQTNLLYSVVQIFTGFLFLVFPGLITTSSVLFMQQEGRLSLRNPVQNLLFNGLPQKFWNNARSLSNGIFIPLASIISAIVLATTPWLEATVLSSIALCFLLFLIPISFFQGYFFEKGVWEQLKQGQSLKDGSEILKQMPFYKASDLVLNLLNNPNPAVQRIGFESAFLLDANRFQVSLLNYFQNSTSPDVLNALQFLKHHHLEIPEFLATSLLHRNLPLEVWPTFLNLLGSNSKIYPKIPSWHSNNILESVSFPSRLINSQEVSESHNLNTQKIRSTSLKSWGNEEISQHCFEHLINDDFSLALPLAFRLNHDPNQILDSLQDGWWYSQDEETQMKWLVAWLGQQPTKSPSWFFSWLGSSGFSLHQHLANLLSTANSELISHLKDLTNFHGACEHQIREIIWPILPSNFGLHLESLKALGELSVIHSLDDYSPLLQRALNGEKRHRIRLALSLTLLIDNRTSLMTDLEDALWSGSPFQVANAIETLSEGKAGQSFIKTWKMATIPSPPQSLSFPLQNFSPLTLALLVEEKNIEPTLRQNAKEVLLSKDPEFLTQLNRETLSTATGI